MQVRDRVALVSVVAAACLFVVAPSAPALASVPSDFDKTPIVSTGLDTPTAFRFAPGGRIFIAEKNGAIRLVTNGVLQATPMITLQTANADERGLLGIELDPNFATNGYLYAAYTHAENLDRLSRFTVTGDAISPDSEVVLLKSNQQANVFHHGGEIRFGPDGKLYWGLGINLYNPNAPNLGTIHGKILRINPDGTIPADNPFRNTPGAEPAIWAYGVRNPFRFDIIGSGPNAGKPLVGDVGGSHFEELDIIDRGANYGWPAAEGVCTGCGYAQPVFTYPHTAPPANAGSITSVAIYTGNTFPSQYHNAVFYADYTLGFVKYLIMDDTFTSVISDNVFDTDAGTPVQLSVGPDGNLYQLDIYPGALYRIAPSGGNRAPVAAVSADVTDGLAPLAVNFSSAGTVDLDGDPLTYSWNFQDGSPLSTEPNPSHVFTTNGVRNVALTVSDGSKSSTANVSVSVGNRRPTGTILTPTAGLKYDAGDTISYSASGTDPEDGSLPASAFEWSVIFHHADHIHPFLGPITGVTSGAFVIPRNADNLSTTWYEIRLTVHDSAGLSHTSSVDVRPNLVNLTFISAPGTLQYTVDGIPFTGTHTELAVVGVDRVVSAPSPQFAGGSQYEYASWSDGGGATHTIRTPNVDATYQATFNLREEPPAPWVSEDIGARTLAGTSAYSAGTFTIDGGGNDIWDSTDELRYVYQPLTGDGSITARVTAQEAVNPWTKSGVIIKAAAMEGSTYAAVGVTPEHGVHFQYGFHGDSGEHPSTVPDGWMRLVRTGDVITGFSSADGVTWTEIGNTTLAMPTQVTVGLFVSSHDNALLANTVFDNVTVTQPSLPGGPLPTAWQRADVDSATPPGDAAYTTATSTFTVRGGGIDIWGDADQSSYVWQTLSGDGSIVARVTAQDATDEWAKAGVMVKESLTAGSPYAAMLVTPGHGTAFQSNYTASTAGGSYTFPDGWLKLARTGSTVAAFRSADGVTWTPVGEVTIAFSPQITIGLFVNAHNGGTALGTATFDHVTLTGGTGTVLPTPWVSGDVGSPALGGSASQSAGVFTVKGAGSDIWGAQDQFQFVHQPLAGDGTIIARVLSQDNTNEWAKSGIMVKGSATEGATYAALMVTPGHGAHLQSNFVDDASGAAIVPPGAWLRLTRAGNTFTAYTSVDGSVWTLLGSRTVTIPSTAEVGLFVSSHNGAAVNTTTFSDVTVSPAGAGTLPAGWTHVDIGGPSVAGTATVNGRTYTVSGAGSDIWGGADQLHYASVPLAGDGSIVARVLSQDNTDEWAKSGVMVKSAATAGSDYVAAVLTPGHGLRVQAHFTADADGGAAAAPVWLKLSRTGSTVSIFRSTNGADWTLVGTETLAGTATVGLFVSSHNSGALNTTVFDNVTVTS